MTEVGRADSGDLDPDQERGPRFRALTSGNNLTISPIDSDQKSTFCIRDLAVACGPQGAHVRQEEALEKENRTVPGGPANPGG